jgi:hypothetical protein
MPLWLCITYMNSRSKSIGYTDEQDSKPSELSILHRKMMTVFWKCLNRLIAYSASSFFFVTTSRFVFFMMLIVWHWQSFDFVIESCYCTSSLNTFLLFMMCVLFLVLVSACLENWAQLVVCPSMFYPTIGTGVSHQHSDKNWPDNYIFTVSVSDLNAYFYLN